MRILAAEEPAAPLAAQKVAADKTFITISWEEPSFNGGVPIELYSVYVKQEGGSYLML